MDEVVDAPCVVNDVHSSLNETRVGRVIAPETVEQVERCYPQFADFLAAKKRHDPGEVFQSDWYRHYRDLFAARSNQANG